MQKKHDNKKILVITHQLSRTGAPIVLLDMVRVYKNQGYKIDVITMLDGELRENLEDMGISVKVQECFIDRAEEFYQFAGNYDMVISNTLITYEVIHILNQSEIPVLWWLHEGKQYFEYFASVLPDFHKLSSNIHVFSVGYYVQQVLSELYEYETEILPFGVEDVPISGQKNTSVQSGENKVKFLTAGTYSKVKAQDVLAEAIRMLPEEYLSQAEFYFCGNEQMYDEEVYGPVKKLCEEYENVTMLAQLPHQEMLKQMEVCDCLIVPSRIDPVPTVAVEMMMKESPCLCTEVCGIAHYIEDGVNGFTVPVEDAKALKDKIEEIIDQRDKLTLIGEKGREIYDKYFSKKVFEPRVKKIAEKYMYPEDTEMKELAKCVLEIEKETEQGMLLSEEEKQGVENSIRLVMEYIMCNYECGEETGEDFLKIIRKFAK